MSLGLGPLLISWTLFIAIRFFPNQPHSFYLTICAAPWVLLAGLVLSKLHSAWYTRSGYTFYCDKKHSDGLALLVSAITLLIAAILALDFIDLPLIANDPLKYATAARIIFSQMSFAPLTGGSADPVTGFYTVGSNPPAYRLLIVWSYLLQGHSEWFGCARLISLAYFFYTLIALLAIPSTGFRLAGAFAALFMLATPRYLTLVGDFHIEPLRLYTVLVTFGWAYEAQKNLSAVYAAWSGLCLGAALFVHALALLLIPILGVLWLLQNRQRFKKSTKTLSILLLVAALIGASQFIENYLRLGSIVQPTHDKFQSDIIDQQDYLRKKRGIDTFGQRLEKGLLFGFSKSLLFGLPYFFLPVAILSLRHKKTDPWIQYYTYAVLLFIGGVMFTVLIGLDTLIMNPRYLLTIQPLAALVAGGVVQLLYESKNIT